MGRSFQSLKRDAKADASDKLPCGLAIAGDCATQHFSVAIKGAGYQRGLDVRVFDADYDQVQSLTCDPSSPLYEASPEFILIELCTEKLYARWLGCEWSDRKGFADQVVQEMKGVWNSIRRNSSAIILQCDYPEYDDRVFGEFALKMTDSFIVQLRRINALMGDLASADPRLALIGLSGIQARMGRTAFHDPKLYMTAKMPMTLDALCEAADIVAAVMAAYKGLSKKCVVLDLDNTLWGGVVGDDGLVGIEVGELGTGPAYDALQHWLKELKARGIILAVCSKNDEPVAKEPFEHHPDMVLSLDDIAAFVANWEDKASNIASIRERLNIGIDSMVFVDDNPFERELVKGMLPDVVAPDLPDDPAQYVSFLQGLDLFEATGFSQEDLVRSDRYVAEGKRMQSAACFDSVDEYLKSLDMRARVSPFDAYHAPRIAQLTQRSNQFNLRTRRYTEADIESVMQSESSRGVWFSLTDRFGDHGLVGIAILEERPDGLFVDTLIMSCRVLRRGMEEFIMNAMVEQARSVGASKLIGEYIPTKKNGMVADLYSKMGFVQRSDGLFELDVEDYTGRVTYIKEERDDREGNLPEA